MENYLNEFLTVALVHFLAVASPGPDFAVMIKQSVSHGRRAGLLTSIGIGTAIFLHVSHCVMGLGLLISESILLFNVVKTLGSLYLIYIGVCAIRSKPFVLTSDEITSLRQPSAARSFWSGFMTNALNPKVTIFFLAVFSVTINPSTPALVKIGYGTWMAVVTTIWFSGLSLLFSKGAVRSAFRRFGHWFERSMGFILIALGLRLALARSE